MRETVDQTECLHRIATAHHGQWLYLFPDGGVLYSETQNRFVGFNAAGVSAYQAFDAGAFKEELRALSTATAPTMELIHALSCGTFPHAGREVEWPRLQEPLTSNLLICDIPALVDFPLGPGEELCRDYFHNCTPASAPAKCHISADCAENSWTICINGCAVLSSLQEEQLGLGFLHAARSLLYAESNYDVAFHAAMVADNTCGLLLCGPREAGKSTLAAYLAAHGFDLLSDEPVLLDLDSGTVALLDLPVSLKEGSWDVLRHEWALLNDAPVHVRSDGTKIRLLHPAAKRETPMRHVTCVIFPEYRPSCDARADRLQPLQVLNFLSDAGMVLAKDLLRNQFEAFLKMLCVTPAYSLYYASLHQAAMMIHGLRKRADWQTTA